MKPKQVVYQAQKKLGGSIESTPSVKTPRQKPTMKIDLKTKLDLEAYRKRHRLRSLGKAVRVLLDNAAKSKEAQ